MAKFDSIQKNMFFPEDEGKLEKKTEKSLNNKKRAAKAADKRKEDKHKRDMEELHKFEKEHPESNLFKDEGISESLKKVYSLIERMDNLPKGKMRG